VTPNLLSDLLKSPQNALDLFSSPSHSGANEEHLRNKIDKLLKRLPNELQSSVHDLMVLRGSFSSDAMAAVLGHKHGNAVTSFHYVFFKIFKINIRRSLLNQRCCFSNG
jgi:hypothetical protein